MTRETPSRSQLDLRTSRRAAPRSPSPAPAAPPVAFYRADHGTTRYGPLDRLRAPECGLERDGRGDAYDAARRARGAPEAAPWGDVENDPTRAEHRSVARYEHVVAEWRDAADCARYAGPCDGRDRLAALARTAARGPGPGEAALGVDTLLRLFASRERLDAADAWRCPRCERRVRAVKQLRLASSPPVLALHLKRFEMLGYHSAKLETPVGVPAAASLDLAAFIDDPTRKPGDPEPTYYLCAVVNHYGTIEFGHYTAYARSRDDAKWRLYNDSAVAVVDDDEVSAPTRAAYLLFLLREDVAPPEWVRQARATAAAAAAAGDADAAAG